MAYMLAFRLDDASAAHLTAMWEKLFVRQLDPTLLLPVSEPLMALAMLDDGVHVRAIEPVLSRVAAGWDAIPATFSMLGVKPGLSPTISLAATPTALLLARHNELHAAIAEFSSDPTYEPGRWMPHVPVTTQASSIAMAIRALLPMMMEPVTGKLAALELVEEPLWIVAGTYPLRAG